MVPGPVRWTQDGVELAPSGSVSLALDACGGAPRGRPDEEGRISDAEAWFERGRSTAGLIGPAVFAHSRRSARARGAASPPRRRPRAGRRLLDHGGDPPSRHGASRSYARRPARCRAGQGGLRAVRRSAPLPLRRIVPDRGGDVPPWARSPPVPADPVAAVGGREPGADHRGLLRDQRAISMWISNTATTAMMLPGGVGALRSLSGVSSRDESEAGGLRRSSWGFQAQTRGAGARDGRPERPCAARGGPSPVTRRAFFSR